MANSGNASDIIRADLCAGALPDGIHELVEALRARYPQSLQAVVYYGSCRRRGDNTDGLVDLLVLVSGYRACHGTGLTALANRLLPPNVYYLEVEAGRQRYRCKYAIVSLPEFVRRCRGGLDTYFRVRFSQPCRLAWSDGDAVTDAIVKARQCAADTFARQVAPLLSGRELDAPGFWEAAMSESYRCELRPERPGAARDLVNADSAYWQAISAVLLPDIPGVNALPADRYRFRFSGLALQQSRWAWRMRRIWGRCLHVARLLKAAGTFANGVDYILWKIERHSGVHVEATPAMRRYPRLAAWGLAWQLWRKGGFR